MWTYVERASGRYVKVAYHDPQRGWTPTKPGAPVPEGVVQTAPAGSWVVLGDRVEVVHSDHRFEMKYRKPDDEDLMAIVGGSFGPDGGASYVEIANVRNIRKRNEEIAAQHNC